MQLLFGTWLISSAGEAEFLRALAGRALPLQNSVSMKVLGEGSQGSKI